MASVKGHPDLIESILGHLVKRWCEINPEAVRQLEKFNRANNNVLIAEPEEKRKILERIRLKAFRGTATGQSIDLSVYAKVFEPIDSEALPQKRPRAKKGGL